MDIHFGGLVFLLDKETGTQIIEHFVIVTILNCLFVQVESLIIETEGEVGIGEILDGHLIFLHQVWQQLNGLWIAAEVVQGCCFVIDQNDVWRRQLLVVRDYFEKVIT